MRLHASALVRHLLNLYPPFLGAGIRVTHIAADWRHLRVTMPLRWYNRNVVGTHFGGSLLAMSDPFFMLMAMHNLGREYVVWERRKRPAVSSAVSSASTSLPGATAASTKR